MSNPIRVKLAAFTARQLAELFDETDKMQAAGDRREEICDVRNAIMDELEARNPRRFNEWMLADGCPSPVLFF